MCIGSFLRYYFGTSSLRLDQRRPGYLPRPISRVLINRQKPTRANIATGGLDCPRTGSPRPLQDTTTCTAVTSCTGSRHPLTSSGGTLYRSLPRSLPLPQPQQYRRSSLSTAVCGGTATRLERWGGRDSTTPAAATRGVRGHRGRRERGRRTLR